jgi:dihydroneopterin aldolase
MHPELQDCRRLFLRNYEVFINIGVHDFEKKGAQRVIFNIDLYIPLSECSPSNDRLEEVVDYHFMRTSVADCIGQGHIHLQETLCDDLANRLLMHSKVRAVRVSTMKPDVYSDCDGVGVEIMRWKNKVGLPEKAF